MSEMTAAQRSEFLSGLKSRGFKDVYERDGEYYVQVQSGEGGEFKEVMPAKQAMSTDAIPFTRPSKVLGGQGGRGGNRRVQDRYNKERLKILEEDDFQREQRRKVSEMPAFGLKDLPVPNAILPDDSQHGTFMTHAGRETDKLISGTADIVDITKGMLGENIMKNIERRKAREYDQAEKDIYSKALDQETSITKLGSMLPYAVTGFSSPLFNKAAGKTIKGIKGGVVGGAKAVGKTTAKEAKGASDIIGAGYKKIQPHLDAKVDDFITNMVNVTKQKGKREIGDPISDIVAGFKTREPITDKFRGTPFKDAIGATGLGAAEGAMHYDEDVAGGALGSLVGFGGGAALKNKLSQAPNLNRPGENEIIKKWKTEYGYRPSPGMEKGIPEVQTIWSNARTDSKFASGVKQVEDANLDAISRVASEASGMDAKTLKNITPDEMNNHVQGLKSRYEELESKTSGAPDIDSFDNVITMLDEYPKSTQTKIMNFIGKVESGYDGKEYKNLRRELKSAHTKAVQGNRDEADAYSELINIMDDSIEEGIKKDLGPGLLEEWRDLNEKYAMTNFMMENAMDASGGINPKKVASKLISTDANRLLTGRGGRIGKFHDIARISAIEQKQAGGGLGSMNVDANPGEKAPGLLSTPQVGSMGPVRRAKFSAFRHGYPNKYGLLGLPREGILSSEQLGRSYNQATGGLLDTISNPIDSAQSWVNSLMNQVMPPEEDQ